MRWELAINDRPVPGGYIEKTDGGFEIHYPHLASKTLPTLDEAKRSLELAPPISAAGLKVEKAAADNSELISTAEAGEMLGVSRFRVNAMVASGVLPGRRDNGKIFVDRSAVERKASQGASRRTPGQIRKYLPVLRSRRRAHSVRSRLEADDADAMRMLEFLFEMFMEDESMTWWKCATICACAISCTTTRTSSNSLPPPSRRLRQERDRRVSLRVAKVVA